VGETAVLFLGNSHVEGHLVILKLGRGRMQVEGSGDDRTVVLTLPAPPELRTILTRVPNGDMVTGARLSDLKAYVTVRLRSAETY
jgi:hypothetical protein